MPRLTEVDYSNQVVYITTNTNKRISVLTGEPRINLLYESLERAHCKYRFKVNGYVIMPDHVHLILVSKNNDLSEILHDIKGYFAHYIFKMGLYQSPGPLWQRGFYDHIIRNEEDLVEKLNYIHANPLRAGLTGEIAGYRHSSFRYYYEENDELPVWFQKIAMT